MVLTAQAETTARPERRQFRWVKVAAFAVIALVASLVAFFAVWHRAPWSEIPSSYHACGTTYWETGLNANQWSAHWRPVPGSQAAPLRLVGDTGGWVAARPVYAYVHSGTTRYHGCGVLTFMKLSNGSFMVYGTRDVDYTIVG